MTSRSAASAPVRLALAALCALSLAAAPTPASAAAPPPAPAAKPAAGPAAAKKAAPAAKTTGGTAVSPRYRFKKPRPERKATKFIILHTTEGGSKGSLAKLSANGECNYAVDTDGTVYTIVDRGKIAYHCGDSMWNGETHLDRVSVGIEIVGWHDKDVTAAQYAALKKLIAELQKRYKVPDERVLTHSMVAYGEPNRWQKRRHRGRKRCGMLLALPAARTRLGLAKKPAFDPDIKAGRLKDADPELTKILYTPMPAVQATAAAAPGGNAPAPPPSAPSAANVIGPKRSAWDIARDLYDAPTTLYAFPDGTSKRGSEIGNWNRMPAGTIVTVGQPASENAPDDPPPETAAGGSPLEIAGEAAAATTTWYFPPGKPYAAGASMPLADIAALPAGTKVLVGYRCGGPVTAKRPVSAICGARWNDPETRYWTKAGGLVPGDRVTDRTIPKGAMVFFRE